THPRANEPGVSDRDLGAARAGCRGTARRHAARPGRRCRGRPLWRGEGASGRRRSSRDAPAACRRRAADHAGRRQRLERCRLCRRTVAIQSGMPEFAAAVTALEPIANPRWRTWRAEARAEYEKGLDPTRFSEAPVLDLGQIMTWLREHLPDDAIVTSDAGNFSGWPSRF